MGNSPSISSPWLARPLLRIRCIYCSQEWQDRMKNKAAKGSRSNPTATAGQRSYSPIPPTCFGSTQRASQMQAS